MSAMTEIAVRRIERVEQLESALRPTVATLEGKPCRQQAFANAPRVPI